MGLRGGDDGKKFSLRMTNERDKDCVSVCVGERLGDEKRKKTEIKR